MLLNETTKDKDGKIINKQSAYNPSKKVRERIKDIQEDYRIAQNIMTSPYEEFGFDENGIMYGLIGRLNYNQKKFNLYRPPKNQDPDLSWHSNALKPIIRNKVISIVAHITSQVLYPDIVAQNSDSEQDKDMANVMKDAVIWACEQSKYEDMFVDIVQEMCVNPAIVLYQDYTDVKRKVKKGGKIEEIVDEIYSGFIASIVPVDELYIGNVYEADIQKQPYLIRRKLIDFNTAKRKYGENENFKYVSPGIKTFFDETNDTFYEDYDEELEERLVEEVCYWNRDADLELHLVNGVLMDDTDEPMRRYDKLYPFAKSVYETFNSRFFYGMALVQKLEPDEDNLTTLWRMFIDGTYLQMMPPISVYGESNMSSGDFAPRSINVFSDPNVRVEPMNLQQNLMAGSNAIQAVEQSMAETSKQEYSPKADTTAREIAYMEEQTKISMGRTGKMVAKLVKDFGQLLVGSIIQYLPIAQLGEIVGDSTALKFPVLFLSEVKDEEGNKVSKKIEFTNDLPEADSKEELDKIEEEKAYEMLNLEQKLGMSISKVRPEYFRNLKYKTKVQATFLSESSVFAKKMMMFDRLAGRPEVDQKHLIKATILRELEPGKEDSFILEEDPMMNEVNKLKGQTPAPQLNNQAFNL